MTNPDPTNGLVTIAKAKTGKTVYHLRECSHYPDQAKPRVLGDLPKAYTPCGYCTRTVEYSNATSALECPFCGETARMCDHLPCEASP